MKTQVVIGANYGDEGKGLLVDYFARQEPDSIVVRFNGGAQAGHTVVDGTKRHVFGTYGSGTLAGCKTYLAKEFVFNTILFLKEHEKLKQICRNIPKVVIHPHVKMTTFYEMIINQLLEESRGKKRHGSCGVGFGETFERHKAIPFTIGGDLLSPDNLIHKLNKIEEWFYHRLDELKLKPTLAHREVIANKNYFIGMIHQLIDKIELGYFDRYAHLPIIFEGAQGLGLSESSGNFPHVTRSETGFRNIKEIVRESGLAPNFTVNYLTRSYLTRHGAGPLEQERKSPPSDKIIDMTNLPHKFQGTLRFAHLDIDELASRILSDTVHHFNDTETRLVVTCLDQMGENVSYFDSGKLGKKKVKHIQKEWFPDIILNKLSSVKTSDEIICSYGPSAKDIVVRDKRL